ncbi:MAG: transposase, partial [Actinomyces ruminicola]|nr:transposase [Actinomyces ruminicola]
MGRVRPACRGMAPGRSKQVFKQWLQDQPEDWGSRIEVVAMDGFTG